MFSPYVIDVSSRIRPFWPQGYNFNELGRVLLDDVAYQISRLLVLWFQTRRFNALLILAYVKHVNPRRYHIWLQWHNLNKLGEGLYYILNIKAVGLAVPD